MVSLSNKKIQRTQKTAPLIFGVIHKMVMSENVQ